MKWLLNRNVMEDDQQAGISPLDRGLTLADSVFDTLKVEDGTAVDALAHMHRLNRNASYIGLDLPCGMDDLLADMVQLIAFNNANSGFYAIRTTLTRGIGQRGLRLPDPAKPTLMMTMAAYVPALADAPYKVGVARSTRRNAYSPLSHIKATAGYADAVLAMREATSKGWDDAILLNTDGYVACGTASNILVDTGEGVLLTPPLHAGVLDGITRARLLAEGKAVERSLGVSDLQQATHIYMCNSLMGVRRVTAFMG